MPSIGIDMSETNRPTNDDPGPAFDQSAQDSATIRLMIDSIRDYAVFMLGPDGNVLSWNTGAFRIMGYAADEIIGCSFSCFYPKEYRDQALQQILEAAPRSCTFNSEGWQIRKDGSRFWATIVTELVRNPLDEIVGFAVVIRDTTEQREAEQALRRANETLERRVEERTRKLNDLNAELTLLADTDSLTGIFNRRGFLPVAKHEIERSRRYRTPLSVLYLDIDKFKLVNDTWGHALGDEILRFVVRTICGQLRGGDVAARIGGDEFVVLLLETTVDRAARVAKRVCEEVAGAKTDDIKPGITISVSVGAAQWIESETVETLLARADAALYMAKQADEPGAIATADAL